LDRRLKYRLSEKGIKTKKEQMKRYNQTTQGLLVKQNASNNYRSKNRVKIINQQFIKRCLWSGILVKKNICLDCKKKTKTEFHHVVYYNPPRLKDLVEVCDKDHKIRHKKGEGEID